MGIRRVRLSAKAHQLDRTPAAALTFYLIPLLRSVRIRGQVTRAPQEDIDADFAGRSLAGQAAALVGPSSTPLVDRATQDAALTATTERLKAGERLPHQWVLWWLEATEDGIDDYSAR